MDTIEIEKIKLDLNNGVSDTTILREFKIDNFLGNRPFPFHTKNGIINLDRRISNLPFNYTDYEIKEIISYKENPLKFFELMKNHLKLNGNEETFMTKSISDIFLYNFSLLISPENSSRFNTSLSSFIGYYLATFNSDTHIMIIGNEISLNRIFRLLYKKTPFFIKKGYSSQRNNISFDNGSSIRFCHPKNIILGQNFDMIIAIDPIKSDIFSSILSTLLARRRSRLIWITSGENPIKDNKTFNIINFREFNREKNLEKIVNMF